jgi:molybdopterin biosynthesis enzyme MoaB
MCAGTMKIKANTIVTRVPGNPSATTRTTTEWVCPDCDYFEEAEEESSR